MGEEDKVPDQEHQKSTVGALLNRPLLPGELWYLVDAQWFEKLKLYLGRLTTDCLTTAFHPGPIDNRNLLTESGALRGQLGENDDYKLVPDELWKSLVLWYGAPVGQEPIARRVVQLAPSYTIVEIYPIQLKCSESFCLGPAVVGSFSKTDSLKTVDEFVRTQFNIKQNLDTRLWLRGSKAGKLELVGLDKVLHEVVAGAEGGVVVESKLPSARWPERPAEEAAARAKKLLNNENDDSENWSSKISRMNSTRQPGLCGLSNLGNTCFMNSVLQCMSNCPPITEYFLAQRHLKELNKVNPLGMRGEIATAFGNLIGTMWSGNFGCTEPSSFKIQLGRFNPVFSGCQQHDSQELLTFLLDGLHEDLNRIKKKPYTEMNDDSDREDKVLAREAWERHRKRNDSIIVDTFHGLLKSRVVCPDCKKVSVTFDPFCNLSLPLPQKKDRFLTVTFIPFDGSKPNLKCRVSVPRHGIVKDLCREMGVRTSTDPNNLLVAEMARSHFHKFYCGEDALDNMSDRDIINIYEVLPPAADHFVVPVVFWEERESDLQEEKLQFFGIPLLVALPKAPLAEADLRLLLLEKLRRHFNMPTLSNCTTEDKTELIERLNKELAFRIYTKDTDTLDPPVLVEFDDEHLDLWSSTFEHGDDDDDDDNVGALRYSLGRRVMILGFTKQLRREVFIEKHVEISVAKQHNYRQVGREKITMQDCLNLFTTYEKLGADDAWYCPNCKKHQRATKKFDLWDLPEILIVHLKRFSYTTLLRDKIDAMVDCPLKNLDMSQYLIKRDRPQSVYNLIGVCNHYGGMGGGHYTASCRNKDTGDWYTFDDSSVHLIAEDRVLTPAAYVLFYRVSQNREGQQ